MNIERLKKLIKQGMMDDSGMVKITDSIIDNSYIHQPRINTFSPYIMKMLNMDTEAKANFDKLPPSQKKNYTMYIMEAKKQETRLRRANEVIHMLKR